MGPAFGDVFTLGCCLISERVRNSSGALMHSWNSGKATVAVTGVGKEGILALCSLSSLIRVHWPDLCGLGAGSLMVEQGARVTCLSSRFRVCL